MRHGLIALCLFTLVPTVVAKPSKLAIYVGPQIRDGFVDVDSGVLDSIKDIRNELKHADSFTLVDSADAATVCVFVVSRHSAGQGGTAAIPAGGATLFFPWDKDAIEFVLRVGDYTKPIVSDDGGNGTWRYAAKRVVKDVTAWVDANRAALK